MVCSVTETTNVSVERTFLMQRGTTLPPNDLGRQQRFNIDPSIECCRTYGSLEYLSVN